MNINLSDICTKAMSDLLTVTGRPVTHTNALGEEATIQALIEPVSELLGEYSERFDYRWQATVAKPSGVVVGDTLTHNGTATATDPYPDPITWNVIQLTADDDFSMTFTVRRAA